MEAQLRIVSGKIQCPMTVIWILFSIHFLYLFVVYVLSIYISMLYIILDIEILFNLQISAINIIYFLLLLLWLYLIVQ